MDWPATRAGWENAAQQKNGLWFNTGPGTDGTDGAGNKGTISAAKFQEDWVAFARHWAGNPTVIGFELRNEPCAHTKTPALWGGKGPTGIHAMYESVGNAILAVNPDALIICETVLNYRIGACEGDLSVVRDLPVALTNPAKLVYSVHEYPKEIGGYRGRACRAQHELPRPSGTAESSPGRQAESPPGQDYPIHPGPGGAPPKADLPGGVSGLAPQASPGLRRALLVGVSSPQPSLRDSRKQQDNTPTHLERLGYSQVSLPGQKRPRVSARIQRDPQRTCAPFVSPKRGYFFALYLSSPQALPEASPADPLGSINMPATPRAAWVATFCFPKLQSTMTISFSSGYR